MTTSEQKPIILKGSSNKAWGIYNSENNKYFLLSCNSVLDYRSITVIYSEITLPVIFQITDNLTFLFEFGSGEPELECKIILDKKNRILKTFFKVLDEKANNYNISFSDSEICY